MMGRKEYYEEMTEAYVYSYNRAMELVKNPNFATQIAMSVIMMETTARKNKEPELNPSGMLAAFTMSLFGGAQANPTSDNKDENWLEADSED